MYTIIPNINKKSNFNLYNILIYYMNYKIISIAAKLIINNRYIQYTNQ